MTVITLRPPPLLDEGRQAIVTASLDRDEDVPRSYGEDSGQDGPVYARDESMPKDRLSEVSVEDPPGQGHPGSADRLGSRG